MDSIKGVIKKITFNGDSTISLSILDNESTLMDLHLLGVQYLELGDIINSNILKVNVNLVGFKHRKILEKRELDINRHKSIWISTEKNDSTKELFGLIAELEYISKSNKYNPISSDKY